MFSTLPVGHYGILRLALEAALLPAGDVMEPGRSFFRLADDAGPIGYVGLEGAGRDRLLRSLVVLPTRRRGGHGRLLVAQVETVAREDGIARLHLLTTSAADFFRACGYHLAERASAPPDIARTAQFSSLCPASAAYLVRDIA